MATKKIRLDKLVVAQGLVPTRSKAQGMILAGEVSVNGVRVDKPGTAVPVDAEITLKVKMPYVGRGGFKLAGALDAFALSVDGMICADVGACTGGFTDVLLQRGATRVYAIDVGYGQLDWKLRQDTRVHVLERTNARYLESLPETVSFVVIDVSFISLKLILPAAQRWLAPGAQIIALIKPQFEAGPAQVGKGGVIRDTAVHRAVVAEMVAWTTEAGLGPSGIVRSPVKGSDGNVEFLLWLRPGSANELGETAVEAALKEEA